MHAWHRVTGMMTAPRATLNEAISRPRSLDLAALILVVAATAKATFLATGVGRLAGLDQQVRQLESVGAPITDELYRQLLALQPYQPLLGAAGVLIGWPILWVLLAAVLRTALNRGGAQASFAQVLTVVVHAAAVFPLRAVIAWPIDYARESTGGATSLGTLFPMLGESTFGARFLGAVDVFAIWWMLLLALGLSILYQRRAASFARWLFGTYAAGATLLAVTQAVRGGI